MVFPFLFGPFFLSLDFYNHLPPPLTVPLDSHDYMLNAPLIALYTDTRKNTEIQYCTAPFLRYQNTWILHSVSCRSAKEFV